MSDPASAQLRYLSGYNGPTTVTSPYGGVVNNGTVSGGTSTGLTVTGTATETVINNGTISGSTGLYVSGSGSTSTVINNGTISGYSSSVAGVYQVP